jgi:hypothetical protein
MGMEAVMTNQTERETATTPSGRVAIRTEPAQLSRSTSGRQAPPPPHLPLRRSIRDRDETDPDRCAAELVQRGRLILDVSVADFEAAEAKFGAFHQTTWHFRNALSEAQRSWERLSAELGAPALDAALHLPPLTTLTLGESADGTPPVVLILIAGQTYRSQRVQGTELAPIQWRLTRLNPPLENGPYYVCRLANGSTQCDCADWTYQIAETANTRRQHCKHLHALAALGWI